MPRPNCEPCCNPTELSRVQSSYRAAVLEILCDIAGGGGTGGGPNRIDVEILCDPGTGDPVVYSYNYETDGTRGAPTAYNLDGTPYVGVLEDLVACGTGETTSASLLEYLICDNKVNKIVQIPVTGSTPGSPTYLLLDRTASAAPADWSLVQAGGCQGIYAEDAAHVSGDRGQLVLGVANDGTALSGSIGDYTPIATTTTGVVFVTDDINVVSSSILGRSSLKAEDAAHTSGNGGKFVLAVRNDTEAVTTDNNGDYSQFSVASNGVLKVSVTQSGQVGNTTGLLKSEDVAHVTGDAGVFVLGVANQALSDLAGDGDYIAQAKTVKGVGLDTLVRANALAFSERAIYTNDEAASNDPSGIAQMFVRANTLTSRTSTNGDISVGIADGFGRQIVAPYSGPTGYVFGNISVTDTTSTQVIAAAGAGIRIYVTNISIANTGGTDVLITFQDGSGGATLWRTIGPTLGGSNISLQVPFFTTANTALFVAAGGSSTTVYISVSGFIAP